jgi:hypothetical protein
MFQSGLLCELNAPLVNRITHQKASLDSSLASSEQASLVPRHFPLYQLHFHQTTRKAIQEPSSSDISQCSITGLTLAADLDHMGILFSSVNNPQISSALACRVALTSTVAVLLTFEPEPEATGLSSLDSDLVGGAGA